MESEPSDEQQMLRRSQVNNTDLVKFVMCTLVSRDCLRFCYYIKHHLYPGNQGTHDKLDQMCISPQKTLDVLQAAVKIAAIAHTLASC